MDEKKSFWTTIPGILTGFASVIAAFTGLYIAWNSAHNGNPQSSAPSPPSTIAPGPSRWPLIAEETFTNTKESSGWTFGSLPSPQTPRFDLRAVDGKYRWDLGYSRDWRRGYDAPYGAAVNFYVGVDAKFTVFTAETTAELTFGRIDDQQYAFRITSTGLFSLLKFTNVATGRVETLIGWTPVTAKLANKFEPNAWNRISVVADEQLIKCYLNSELQGEYRDIGFAGGKVGLAVGMNDKGAAVIDFDNFEFRRKP